MSFVIPFCRWANYLIKATLIFKLRFVSFPNLFFLHHTIPSLCLILRTMPALWNMPHEQSTCCPRALESGHRGPICLRFHFQWIQTPWTSYLSLPESMFLLFRESSDHHNHMFQFQFLVSKNKKRIRGLDILKLTFVIKCSKWNNDTWVGGGGLYGFV